MAMVTIVHLWLATAIRTERLYTVGKSLSLCRNCSRRPFALRLTSQMQQHTTARMAATTPPRITVPTRSDAVISFRSLVDGNDMLRVHVSFVVVRIGQGGVCKRRANIQGTLRWNHMVALPFLLDGVVGTASLSVRHGQLRRRRDSLLDFTNTRCVG